MADRDLIERSRELSVFDAASARLGQGEGGVVVVEGVAGVGKTTLLGEVHQRAGRAGIRILVAGGAEFEQGHPYAVVRQLFEPALRAMTPAQRQEVLAARPGWPPTCSAAARQIPPAPVRTRQP